MYTTTIIANYAATAAARRRRRRKMPSEKPQSPKPTAPAQPTPDLLLWARHPSSLPDNASEATLSDYEISYDQTTGVLLRCPKCDREVHALPYFVDYHEGCPAEILITGNRLSWWYPELSEIQSKPSHWRRMPYRKNQVVMYKIIDGDASPEFPEYRWNLPSGDQAGKWMPKVPGKVRIDHNGYHLCPGWQSMTRWLGYYRANRKGRKDNLRVFEVDTKGQTVTDQYGEEAAAAKVRLTREIVGI